MQTFLPYASFDASAAVLDRQRLGKQRVEALQIMRALTKGSKGWSHHPAVLMWRGYELALAEYTSVICDEWTSRGYVDTCKEKTLHLIGLTPLDLEGCAFWDHVEDPEWLGDPALHASHRSNLLRKMPSHYGQFGWTEPDDLPYVWPTNQEETT